MNPTEEQVEAIRQRMFRRRLDQWELTHKGWNRDDLDHPSGPKRKSRDVIRELLAAGHRVTAGYYPTSIRGYHRYVILWKERKGKVEHGCTHKPQRS